jgi:hypothetical protein
MDISTTGAVPAQPNFAPTVPAPQTAPANGSVDLYQSFLDGYEGVVQRGRLAPAGFTDKDITTIKYITLKPDGEFFAKDFAKITAGTKKGDRESRRNCLLRYLLWLFPKALIIDSGGTDASFHVVVQVDELFQQNPEKFKEFLEQVRLMSFCDELGGSILGSQSARLVGSVNSKSNLPVREIQPSTGTYSTDDLNALISLWYRNPVVNLIHKWFGLGNDDRKARCPFHDSKDMDLSIDADDVDDAGAVCFGSNNCAKGGKPARISIIGGRGKKNSLAELLIAHPLISNAGPRRTVSSQRGRQPRPKTAINSKLPFPSAQPLTRC